MPGCRSMEQMRNAVRPLFVGRVKLRSRPGRGCTNADRLRSVFGRISWRPDDQGSHHLLSESVSARPNPFRPHSFEKNCPLAGELEPHDKDRERPARPQGGTNSPNDPTSTANSLMTTAGGASTRQHRPWPGRTDATPTPSEIFTANYSRDSLSNLAEGGAQLTR